MEADFAEEVTSELVAALRERDAARFAPLVISDQELRALGLAMKGRSRLRLAASATRGFAELAKVQGVFQMPSGCNSLPEPRA